MEVINEFTRMKISNRIVRFVDDIIDGILIFSYTTNNNPLNFAYFFLNNGEEVRAYYNQNKITLDWSPYLQSYYYISKNYKGDPFTKIAIESELKPGIYKYSFDRKYEAVQNFKLFDNKQVKIKEEKFPISDYVKRSIGIEFESSLGYISEKDCFDYGLIPLRDGSISGIEYSTVILKGNKGFNLLKKQLELLSSYTYFNKECSLHIHFGDFPLDPDKIFRLYTLLHYIEGEIMNYVPDYTFRTELYKANGKSYCKLLNDYASFNDMFYNIVGQKFFGSLVQPHPADPTRTHKWNIDSRYYWCNFVNLLCYNVNKTVEFRFLRPTYNLEKILTWIYILNALLTYAEGDDPIYSGMSIDSSVLTSVYPEEVNNMLHNQLMKLLIVHEMQKNNGDAIGADILLENRIFDSTKII